jgi:hypothetical protein
MAFPLDTSFGVKPEGPAFEAGAASGTITTQPAPSVARLGKVALAWTGGANGTDRPVDRAFVSAQRIVGKRWRTVDSDLALAMFWRSDGAGRYTLEWQPAATVPVGTYRLRVTASRYELISSTFTVTESTAARVRSVRRAADGSVRATLAFAPYGARDLIPRRRRRASACRAGTCAAPVSCSRRARCATATATPAPWRPRCRWAEAFAQAPRHERGTSAQAGAHPAVRCARRGGFGREVAQTRARGCRERAERRGWGHATEPTAHPGGARRDDHQRRRAARARGTGVCGGCGGPPADGATGGTEYGSALLARGRPVASRFACRRRA